jgi:hypothetical protein
MRSPGEGRSTSIARRLAAAAAIALAGCSTSGILLVRGVVRAQTAIGPEPLGGVTIASRDGRDGVPRYSRATTQDDGAYRIEHRYSGTWFPGLKPRGADVWVEFFAPGYVRRLVRARGGDEAGVVRGESGPFTRLDVTLVPEPAAGR